MSHPLHRRLVTASVAALTATVMAAAPAAAGTSPAGTTGEGAAVQQPVQVDLVDSDATTETRSLFAYLQDPGGILFGHQHTTDYGETFDVPDGTSSDVRAATGDYPAVFGFDTLIIEGRERPGSMQASREQNALTLAQSIVQAHRLGGISTLSMHMENVVTGGDFYDTSGDALRAVLPGGVHHQDLREYLDLVALAADNAVTADGTPVPIIFRPWHENAGSWFWWGAAFGTPGEYAELFRFTVEYLRDVKDVHNLLYAFSPGGGWGGDAERYLRTYPGDEFVDVLGFDTYDDAADAAFLSSLVTDLGMISRLAAERGKVAAATEIGIDGGVRPDGENANPTWYTDVLDAILADPDAAQIAYLLTWANFGGDTTPYTPTTGEMLADFVNFYQDPATVFAADASDELRQATEAVLGAPVLHLASPADGARVPSGPVELRASVTGAAADRVWVQTEDGTTIELSPPGDDQLWWTGQWDVPAQNLDNSSATLVLHADASAGQLSRTTSVVLGPEPQLPNGVVDDFESYGDDAALRAEYVQYQANEISLVSADDGAVGAGERAMRMSYSFDNQSYTGAGRQVEGDWSSFFDFEAWIDPDGSGNKLVLQLVADGVAFEAYPSLAGDEPYLATIPFLDWRPAPWDTANADRRLTPQTLARVSQFNVYVNHAEGGAESGTVLVDELRAVAGEPPEGRYRDIPWTDPDRQAIEWLGTEVLDLGDANGRFHPNRAVHTSELTDVLAAYSDQAPTRLDGRTRLDLAVALWELAGQPVAAQDWAGRDVPSDARQAVAWAVGAQVMTPVAEDRFGSRRPVDRRTLAVSLFALDSTTPVHDELQLADFAAGSGDWTVPDWEGNGGTATRVHDLLAVHAGAGGNWLSGPGGVDLTSRRSVLLDVADSTGMAPKVALQVGPDWTWCETAPTAWVSGPHQGGDAVTIDLTTLPESCRTQLDDVRGIHVYLAQGEHDLAGIRVR